jgi:hypothetical protein
VRTELCVRDRELTAEDLTLVVTKLTQIAREATLDYAIRVGSLIVHYFYEGDSSLWRCKGPKASSFRRLAEHPELPMSASVLCRCVAIFELCERLNVVARWRRVTVSHLRLVLRLDAEKQGQLLAAADAGRWSVQRLAQEVRPLESASPRRTGRRLGSPLLACARTLERSSAGLARAVRQTWAGAELSSKERGFVADTLERSIQELSTVREFLAGTAPRPQPSVASARTEHPDGNDLVPHLTSCAAV